MFLELVDPIKEDRKRLEQTLDPQRVKFVEEYAKSRNIEQASQLSGYPLVQAQQAVQYKPRWFNAVYRELSRDTMLSTAEDGMEEILNLPIHSEKTIIKTNEFGEDETLVEKVIDKDILKVKADMIKYATSTLGKDSYSTRTEEHKTTLHVNINQKLKELEDANNKSHTIIEP